MAWTKVHGEDNGGFDANPGVFTDAAGVYFPGSLRQPDQHCAVAGPFIAKYDHGGNESWTRCGELPIESGLQVAVYSTNVYFAGQGGWESGGSVDVIVGKLDPTGNEVWTRSFGSPEETDRVEGLAVHSTGLYVTGTTGDTLPGHTGAGGTDVFIRKYDHEGNHLWTRQLGSPQADAVHSLVMMRAGVFIAGRIGPDLPQHEGAEFARLYGHDGTERWTRWSQAHFQIAAHGDNLYVTESPSSNSLTGDVVLSKYQADGSYVWSQRVKTEGREAASSLAADVTGVYVAGQTNGRFLGQSSSGGYDFFLRKYDHSGNEIWTAQFGTEHDDRPPQLSLNETGVYLSGTTFWALPGQASVGEWSNDDLFIRKYRHDGAHLWTLQFGTDDHDQDPAFAIQDTGIYVSWASESSPGRAHRVPPRDLFLRKLVEKPVK